MKEIVLCVIAKPLYSVLHLDNVSWLETHKTLVTVQVYLCCTNQEIV